MARRAEARLLGPNGFRYRQQYGVIVHCKNERDQARTYNVLTWRGFRCKVVTV
jgi:hypothetical protein